MPGYILFRVTHIISSSPAVSSRDMSHIPNPLNEENTPASLRCSLNLADDHDPTFTRQSVCDQYDAFLDHLHFDSRSLRCSQRMGWPFQLTGHRTHASPVVHLGASNKTVLG